MTPEQRVLEQLNVTEKMDAGQTAHLLNELRHVKAATYDVLYAPKKFRQFVPVDSSAGPAAETITYRQWDMFGMAAIISPMSDNIPLVGATVKEFSSMVESMAVAYRWDIQELRRSAMAGSNLETRKAQMAREAVENFLEVHAATGSAQMTGFLNNANVPITVLPHLGVWSSLTPAQIIANLNALATAVVTNTQETHVPDQLILGTKQYMHISQTPIAVDNQMTILQSFLTNNPYIKSVDQWIRCNGAGASGKDRIIAYRKDPMIVTFNVPLEFEQFPPQAEKLKYTVYCHGRVGGVEWHYPLAATYADIAVS